MAARAKRATSPCRGLAIATVFVQCSLAEAARYLLYRIRDKWPDAYIEAKGDQYSHFSKAIPASFTVVSKADTKRTPAMVVKLTPSGIDLGFKSAPDDELPEASEVAEFIADDPLWAPFWVQPITRY